VGCAHSAATEVSILHNLIYQHLRTFVLFCPVRT
jgi:hypothetical protein